VAQGRVGYRVSMPRTPRTSTPALLTTLLVATLCLAGCGGGDDGGGGGGAPKIEGSSTPVPKAKASALNKSCQAIVGSGSVEDIAKIFDKYKNNSTPFTTKDAQAMHNAMDRLAKAGDNAAPAIRQNVVDLVADVGSLIDSRAKLEGVGRVASVGEVQKEINALCR
jgi:hypothetical protein